MAPRATGAVAAVKWVWLAFLACTVGLAAPRATAVALDSLEGFEALYGVYAPGGRCDGQPRITVERTGFTFEWAGRNERAAKPEYAAAYAGPDYKGITRYFFPFTAADGTYPILMTFNDAEKAGTISIAANDAGYAGGPPLTPRDAALIKGSPYAKCR